MGFYAVLDLARIAPDCPQALQPGINNFYMFVLTTQVPHVPKDPFLASQIWKRASLS